MKNSKKLNSYQLYLALYKGTWIERLIQCWYGSTYIHCEIYSPNTHTCFGTSPLYGRVRSKTIQVIGSAHWDLIPIPINSEDILLRIIDVLKKPLHKRKYTAACFCATVMGLTSPHEHTPKTLKTMIVESNKAAAVARIEKAMEKCDYD